MTLTNDADRYTYQLVADKMLGSLAECRPEEPGHKLNASDWEQAATDCFQWTVDTPHPSATSQDEEEIPSLSWPKQWHSTANIRRWYESTCHATGVLMKVMNSGKLWTYPQFSNELANRYPNYNATVLRIAWRILPDTFKKGPGRPASR